MQELYSKLADILEVDEVNDTDVLTDFESWDSLTSLSIISLINSDYGVTLSAEQLRASGTVGELIKLVQSKKG